MANLSVKMLGAERPFARRVQGILKIGVKKLWHADGDTRCHNPTLVMTAGVQHPQPKCGTSSDVRNFMTRPRKEAQEVLEDAKALSSRGKAELESRFNVTENTAGVKGSPQVRRVASGSCD